MSNLRLGTIFGLAAAFAPSWFDPDEPMLRGHGTPRRHANGGTASGAAAAKRAKRRRRNITKHPRGAA